MPHTVAGEFIEGPDIDVDNPCGVSIDPPHQMLLLALVQRAIEDLNRADKEYVDAFHWLFENQSSEIMSIQWICDALGLDVDYFRRKLRRFLKTHDAATRHRITRPSHRKPLRHRRGESVGLICA